MGLMDGVMLAVRDEDGRFQDTALRMGYRPTQYKDCTSVFEMDKNWLEFELPEGFVVTSMRDTFDPYQYGRILWNGFNATDTAYRKMGLGRASVRDGGVDTLRVFTTTSPNIPVSFFTD